MCGITGVINYGTRRAVQQASLDAMCATLVHRGPDEAGSWRANETGIAMRRLSIVDVAGGHQPIANETGDCRIVFNGEIYNHRALRRELIARGHRFTTESDAEAILHLYEDEGEAAFKQLDGMFAIAIVDEREPDGPRLVLARDRLGKKPLFYADLGGTLVFGSELKAILAHGGVSRELDIEALHHYLSLMVVPEPLSIYRHVKKLSPGCVLACTRGGIALRRYWSYADVIGREREVQPTTSRDVRDLLFAAVEKRLDLEVPFGAFLSGGLDSGSVVAIMSQLLSRPVKTFSIGFEGPASHDELPVAARTAKYFKTEHHELHAKPDIVELVHELVHFADEPLAISSSIPLLLLAREARKSVKVVFTGDGGDEVFGGYNYYRFERWARSWRRLPTVVDRAVIAAARNRRVPVLARAARFVRNSRRGIGARRLGWASGFSEEEKREICTGPAASWDHPTTPSLLESRLAAYADLPYETQLNALDILLWLPDEMLAKVDRMTMASSIEARSPLLDDALVARLAGMSFDDKLQRPWTPVKPMLRDAIADLLPPHLRTGRKWGFNVPLDHWFRGGAAPFVDATLSPERLAKRGLFDPTAVAVVAAQRAGVVQASNRLFALIVFETWAEQHL